MKAVILAAGKGERLQPVTSQIPKPMIRFRGKPILEHNIELCKRIGIREFYVNTHYLHEVIQSHFGNGEKLGVSIHYSYEEELLGTSGAVKNFEQILGSHPFFVVYGDNYSNYDMLSLKLKSERHGGALGVIGFHWRDYVAESGVAEFDADGRITRFLEKPKPNETTSHWVNAGVYYFQSEILQHIPVGFSDFAKDIFPKLLALHKPLYGVCSRTDVRAFDTPEMYNSSMKE